MTAHTVKPYAMLGSGRLTSSLWKSECSDDDWSYRFNLFHIDQQNGSVSSWLEPQDLTSLLKLVRVLSFELAEDGCIDAALQRELQHLAVMIDEVLSEAGHGTSLVNTRQIGKGR